MVTVIFVIVVNLLLSDIIGMLILFVVTSFTVMVILLIDTVVFVLFVDIVRKFLSVTFFGWKVTVSVVFCFFIIEVLVGVTVMSVVVVIVL